MKVTEHLNRAGETLFSFEVIPPVKGKNIEELYQNIDPLMEFKPPFIDVTTSREEYVYIDRDGLLDKKRTRMRPLWRIYQGRDRIPAGGLSVFGY